MSERSFPAQPGMFELTSPDPGPGIARWVYPCGLCNALEVEEAGGLCESCGPIPFRKPVRRQTSAKTPKTAMRTPARPRKPAAKSRTGREVRGGGRRG